LGFAGFAAAADPEDGTGFVPEEAEAWAGFAGAAGF
jgi:hypothetical protein